MRAFATLLERLAFTAGRNAKLALLERYFRTTPDPDRGYALAALTGGLDVGRAKPALLRGLVAERVDAALFAMSHDYVGDLAETIALIWPAQGTPREIGLAEVVVALSDAGKAETAALIAGWLDDLGPSERLALIKLVTGALRVGASARLARTALAQLGALPLDDIEEIWAGLRPPYGALFDWLAGGARPEGLMQAPFRPVMLSTPIDAAGLGALSPADFAAEWKWDGIRVQAVCEGGLARLYTRTGEDISASFPDIVAAMRFDGALDGELLVRRGDQVAPSPICKSGWVARRRARRCWQATPRRCGFMMCSCGKARICAHIPSPRAAPGSNRRLRTSPSRGLMPRPSCPLPIGPRWRRCARRLPMR